MGTWTDDDAAALLRAWQYKSATQIGIELGRSRSAICGKIMRMRRSGEIPTVVVNGRKHYDIDPKAHMRVPVRKKRVRTPPPRPPKRVPTEYAARPCALLDLDDKRCHWPLGATYERAVLFCGGDVNDGCVYCPHHLAIAHHQPRSMQ